MMDKAPDAYRTISEVGEDLDLPQHVLRFWETRFAQIKPLKRGGGRRYYRPDDVELLKGIRHLLYKEGYTIKGVQRILKEQGVKAVQAFVRESLSGQAFAPPPVEPAPPPRPEPVLHSVRSVAPELPRGFDEISPPRPPVFEPAARSFEAHEAADVPLAMEPGFPGPPVEPDVGFTEQAASVPFSPIPETQLSTFQAAAPPPPAGQVSMFRGGLQRGEGAVQPALLAQSVPMAEFSSQIRERVEHPGIRPEVPGRNETPALGSRDALLMALEELIACRAVIDQVLAGRQE